MKRSQTESIEDCIGHLRSIAYAWDTKCNSSPSVFQIFDSNIFYYVARLYSMLQDADLAEVGRDIYASLDYCKQRESFDEIIAIINESLTNAYRTAGAIVDFKDIDVLEETTLLSIPESIGVLNANELYEKICNVRNMTAETYREVHKYLSAALVQIEECLFPSSEKFKVYDQFKEGYKEFAKDEGEEQSSRLEQLASHFKIHMTEELAAEHWEKLYKLDCFAFSCATTCSLVDEESALTGGDLLKGALTEELADNSTYLIDDKWNEIFPYSYRKDLQDNRRILENIKQRAKKSQLVFPEVIDIDDFFGYVDSKNLDLLYGIMFRINLELRKIFPHMEEEYCERMGIEPMKIAEHEKQGLDDEVEDADAKQPTKTEKPRGTRKKFLFALDGIDTKEDKTVKQREKERLCSYLSQHCLKSRKLVCTKDDTLNKTIVCFLLKWMENGLTAKEPSGGAVFRFLTEDCGIVSEVQEKAYGNRVKEWIKDKNDYDTKVMLMVKVKF